MNGRMYDAGLCRFLSPDPYVQMPDYSQNFNRYSYALNNPLVYTDPSGEFIFTILCAVIPGAQVFLPLAVYADAALIMGTINTISNWDDITDQSDGMNPWVEGGAYFGLGALNGVLTATANPALISLGGAINSAGNSALRGGSPEDIAQEAFWGGVTAFAGAKLTGPLASRISPKLEFIKSEALRNVITDIGTSVPIGMSLVYGTSRLRGFNHQQAWQSSKTAGLYAAGAGIISGLSRTYLPRISNQNNESVLYDGHKDSYYGDLPVPKANVELDMENLYRPELHNFNPNTRTYIFETNEYFYQIIYLPNGEIIETFRLK